MESFDSSKHKEMNTLPEQPERSLSFFYEVETNFPHTYK